VVSSPDYEGIKAREPRMLVRERSGLLATAERVVRLDESWGRLEHAVAWKAKLGTPALPAEVFAP
jgi:hypothetical protein